MLHYYTILKFFTFSFILSFLLTLFFKKLSFKLNILDKHDNHESDLKIHKKPIPLMGGSAILSTLFITLTSVLIIYKPENFIQYIIILIFSILISTLSLYDDCKQISILYRLAIQAIAAIFLVIANIKISFIFMPMIFSFIITPIYILGVINSFNMIDGMDGLCTTLSIISCIGFFIIGITTKNIILISLSTILSAGLIGFLLYNFHPAKIFLGDNGSTLIGFLLAVMAIISTRNASTFKEYLIPILILGVPIFDMVIAIIRRLLSRKSIFYGDRGHIYDLLLLRNISQVKVLGIISCIHLILVSSALFFNFF
jgi:UDP-GlcNAc:undecaprenyl-phosphate GlcNAc-1-phosphate transferase